MYFTSSIGDAIRIPLEINGVCLVLLQPRRLTSHRSCTNDGTIHHNRAVPWAPSTDSSDLPPHLRQPPLPQLFSDQPNDVEVDMATAKRLYTCCITYYSTFMSSSEPPLPQLLQRPILCIKTRPSAFVAE